MTCTFASCRGTGRQVKIRFAFSSCHELRDQPSRPGSFSPLCRRCARTRTIPARPGPDADAGRHGSGRPWRMARQPRASKSRFGNGRPFAAQFASGPKIRISSRPVPRFRQGPTPRPPSCFPPGSGRMKHLGTESRRFSRMRCPLSCTTSLLRSVATWVGTLARRPLRTATTGASRS